MVLFVNHVVCLGRSGLSSVSTVKAAQQNPKSSEKNVANTAKKHPSYS